jgi:hypothetical protein
MAVSEVIRHVFLPFGVLQIRFLVFFIITDPNFAPEVFEGNVVHIFIFLVLFAFLLHLQVKVYIVNIVVKCK